MWRMSRIPMPPGRGQSDTSTAMGEPSHDPAGVVNTAKPHRPRLGFVVAGAQKAGTTALAQFLASHPQIRVASGKEVHLFDAPDYSPSWTPREIDERYRPHFKPADFDRGGSGLLLGEATPIYLFLPEVAVELKRYNPELRVIVLLRDPVRRAISHYHMEKARGAERLPLWLALLAEPFRLRRGRDVRTANAAIRTHAYRRRGLYSHQLRNLFASFGRSQVLLVRSESLSDNHDATLRRVFAFLGVSKEARVPPARVFEGEPAGRHPGVSAVLCASYVFERIRLRALLRDLEVV